jgi:biotin carboxyl carrier protein
VSEPRSSFDVVGVGDGLYRVSDGTRTWTVAIAGPADNRWVWIDGHVARVDVAASSKGRGARSRSTSHDLSAPMPATVVRVLVAPGATVTRGATLVMLEAMKMELPIRAPRDGVVSRVHCKAGELVQPGVNLLELE